MNKAVKTVSFIVVATMLSKIMGMLRDVFVASSYGTSYIAAAFSSASRIPILFFDLTLGAAILSTFIPVFNKYYQKGDKKRAFEFSNNFITLVFLITLSFCVLGSIFSNFLVGFIAPGLEPEVKLLTEKLLIILLPTTIFTGLAFSAVGILQSFDEFNIPAIISLVSNAIVIVYLVFFNKIYGVYGLAVAMLLGWSMQLFIQIPSLIKNGYRYKFRLDFKDEGIKEVIKLSIPVLISSWVQPITVTINTMYGSYLNHGAAVAALDYANKLYIIIVGVFAFAITNYVFPTLSRLIVKGDNKEFSNIMVGSVRTIILIIAPIMVGMAIMAKDIISIIYQRGSFDETSVLLCSSALMFYSIGMVSYGINEILNKCFYAMKKPKIPMIASMFGILTTIALSTIFMNFTNLGIGGLALSASLCSIVITLIIISIANKEFHCFFNRNFFTYLFKIAISVFAMGIVTLLSKHYFAGLNIYISVALTVILAAITYAIFIIALKIEEVKNILDSILKRNGGGAQ